MTTDTTVTDVDTDEGCCYECGSDLLEKPFLRGAPNPGPICPVCNPDIVLRTLEHERSRCDELERLALGMANEIMVAAKTQDGRPRPVSSGAVQLAGEFFSYQRKGE